MSVTTDRGATSFLINNIVATNTLTHRSIVGKQDAVFYGIAGLDGTTVMINNGSDSAAGTTYYGTTESVTIYHRPSLFYPYTGVAGVFLNYNASPSQHLTHNIAYTGGWNTSNTTQDDYTVVCGTSNQYAFYLTTGSAMVSLNRFIANSCGLCNLSGNISHGSIENCIATGTGTTPFYVGGPARTYFKGCSSYGAGSSGFDTSAGLLENCAVYSSIFRAFAGHSYSTAGCTSPTASTVYQSTASGGSLYHYNPVEDHSAGARLTNTNTYNINHNVLRYSQTNDYNIVYNGSGYAQWQTGTKYGTDPGAWRVTMKDSCPTTKDNPTLWLKIGEIAATANTAVTYTRWIKKDAVGYHNVYLYIPGFPWSLPGISTTYDLKADDTDWEQLSVTVTPTSAGIIPVFLVYEKTSTNFSTTTSRSAYVGSATIS